jgi:GNAT superfamily N-acetyltransferase
MAWSSRQHAASPFCKIDGNSSSIHVRLLLLKPDLHVNENQSANVAQETGGAHPIIRADRLRRPLTFTLDAMQKRVGANASPSVRRAAPSDAKRVTEIVQVAYAHWVPRIGRQPWPMQQDYASVIETARVFVAEREGQLIGVLVLCETADGLLLDNVAVLPASKGQGVGKALLVHAEKIARAMGHSSIYLYTNERMSENIALYAKVGYVEYERRQEQGFRRVFMRKALL